jgi:hypothetical protein
MSQDSAVTARPGAFWLLPAGPDAARLQGFIHRLAQEHGTDPFEPHVTLHVGSYLPNVDVQAVLARVALALPPLTLEALETRDSDAYFKALHVEIAIDRHDGHRLTGLRQQLARELLRSGRVGDAQDEPAHLPAPQQVDQALASYDFLPHLSLLYGELPAPLRRRLAVEHDLQGRSMLFDRIAGVRPAAGHEDLGRVAHWEVFGHQRLGG